MEHNVVENRKLKNRADFKATKMKKKESKDAKSSACQGETVNMFTSTSALTATATTTTTTTTTNSSCKRIYQASVVILVSTRHLLIYFV